MEKMPEIVKKRIEELKDALNNIDFNENDCDMIHDSKLTYYNILLEEINGLRKKYEHVDMLNVYYDQQK